jgi:hypothetical protein
VSLNRFFVLNFSRDGIRWRFEAFRTGKSFKQVVQEHSLMCPVTQVFLIHRRTGLLIKQVQQISSDMHDGDMVSGMLTAIQDFVHDSFSAGNIGQLEVIRIGDVTVVLEQGPLAILAAIISQGAAPQNLRQTFRRALEQISDDYHEELVNFRGNVGEFEGIELVLESCLKARLLMGEDRVSPMTGLVLLIPIVLIAVFGFLGWQQHLHWKQYIDSLENSPGIIVMETGWKGFHRFVRGLRDPLVPDPVGMLVKSGISPDDINSRWESYHSLAPELIKERIRRSINPPPSVSISLRNGIESLNGTAPWSWVEHVPAKIQGISGVTHVRIDGVKQTGIDQKLAWNQYLAKIAELPGILVLKQGRGRNAFYISGMRDAMAPDPIKILIESGMDTNAVISHWEPFQALHPSLIIARARRMLEPPDSVELKLEGKTLNLKGSASHAWIAEARLVTRGIAGISEFDASELKDVDMDKFKALIPVFNEYVFYYLVNHRDLWPGQEAKYKEFLDSVKMFSRVAGRIGGGYHIEIRGHVLSSGSKEVDKTASEAIAERFYTRLKSQGLDMNLFSKFGAGGVAAEAAAKSKERKRESHVSFRIVSDD